MIIKVDIIKAFNEMISKRFNEKFCQIKALLLP